MKKILVILFTFCFLPDLITAQTVKTGLEVLQDNNFSQLKGKKVGLITNPTGVNHQLESTVDIFFKSPEVNLVALYGPEHGVRGDYSAGDH
ncbi:MAG: DUF1343 domain-containing protein, partial [Bacteroidales bacterium]|nr:DUF1343 domain-containing protein [Bacteroidales bacterium]